MNEWLFLGAFFLAGAGLSFIALILYFRARTRPDPAFDDVDSDDGLVLGPATSAFAGQMPMSSIGKTELTNELRNAGFYRPTALLEYRAVRGFLVLVTIVATAMLALAADRTRLVSVLIGGLIAIILAFSLPRLYIAMRARRRAKEIERGLPLVIDLLILCLTAGQNLLMALRQTATQLRRSHPVLAQELAITQRQAELHSLPYAMKHWADRVAVPDVRNLALLLIQSERLGTDAADTLQELANSFRTRARQLAEAHANRTSFWMLIPSVFCFWVAAAIVLFGPAYLEFTQFRTRSAQHFNQVVPNLERANQPVKTPGASTATSTSPTASPPSGF